VLHRQLRPLSEDRSVTAARDEHWDDVYRTKAHDEVSWFQTEPTTSLRLLLKHEPAPASVIDVGAGTSALPDALVAAGVGDVTVLDVSEAALATVSERLAAVPPEAFVVADVTAWTPPRTWAAWHDRAVFHFLTDAADRAAYVAAARAALGPGGFAVIATFAADGPEMCSGLPTARYDADALAAEFGDGFALEHAERELHRTPAGAGQAFTWVVLRRT
jgi:SAM-dependent methyltransferase